MPSADVAVKLARVLNTTVEYLSENSYDLWKHAIFE